MASMRASGVEWMAGWAGGMALNAPWHGTGGTLQATPFTTDVMVGEHLSPGSLPTLGNVPVTRLRIVPKEKGSRPCSEYRRSSWKDCIQERMGPCGQPGKDS